VSSPAGSRPDVGVVVVAAGAGVRAGPGEPKQFRPILGVPMLLRALRPFTGHPEVRQVVVALPPGYAERPPEWLGKLRGERLGLVAGGAQRVDSVRAGIRALPADTAVILVHDAARPFVSRGTIDAVISRARAGVGAVAAVPTSDTLKEIGQGPPQLTPRVARTVDRERIWRAQTPQGFPRQMLNDAYARLATAANGGGGKGGGPPNDDAEVCERAGFPVELIPDSPYNFKVTTADDFRIAEALARELR
jgi:2-C-methyl-D-erythritol 4-phosphate cytidylyltransferase